MEQLHNTYISRLLNQFKPQVILEIGVLEGKHTFRLLEWCMNNNSKLISIDPCKWKGNIPENYKRNALNFCYRRDTEKQKEELYVPYIEDILKSDLQKNWECYKDFSIHHLASHPDEKYDFVFLDGDHNYYTVFNELNLLKRHISQDGLIFIHDICNKSCARNDFYYDWTVIPKRYLYGERQGILTAIDDFINENPLFRLHRLLIKVMA